jgi:CelD/BcsL family acetyltransferase involved in cellulose biosynthesis
MTTIEVVRGSELTADQIRSWTTLLETEPSLDNPFFRPELATLLADVRDDVEVAVLSERSCTVGFFPFQRCRGGVAQALCGRLSEFHGAVAPPDARWDPSEMIRACRLKSWAFDHLLAAQVAFQPHIWGYSDSPFMDLRQGFEAYLNERRRHQPQVVAQILRKSRKIAREIGPLRLELHVKDEGVYRQFLDWKSQQYVRTGVLDVFRFRWVRDMLDRLRHSASPDFAGCLTALYAGDRLVATTFAIRSRRVLHSWFPTYDRSLAKYSPGLIQLLELARACADAGLERLDLGKGEERYKRHLQSGSTTIAEGAVDRRPITAAVKRGWYSTKRWIRSSQHRETLELPLVWTRYLRQRISFR